jgi:hypothetical protein
MANYLPDKQGHACFEKFKLDSDADWHLVLRFAGSANTQRHSAGAGIRPPLTHPDGVAILTQKLFKATLAMTLPWHNLPELRQP